MKDLDFDELDRAVNSLIANKPLPTATPVDTPVLQQAPAILPTIPVVPIRPAVERPSTGRFMDVVHPSSNMRTSLVMPERTTSAPVEALIEAPNVQTLISPAVNDEEDADINQISKDISDSLNQSQNEPIESPFLAGAKVEKRPLNALYADNAAANLPQMPISMPQFGDSSKDSAQSLAEINTPLPAELQSDLLSIESDESSQIEEPESLPQTISETPIVTNPVVEASSAIAADPTPILAPVIAPTAAPIAEKVVAPVVAESQPAPILTASIQQQYKEQPNSGDKDNGAIYDTNTYHKAMVNPIKKKSSWMWIIWTLLLMTVSVGAGVAVYFFVLPLL